MNKLAAMVPPATRRLHVVLSQGQSQNPAKKQLENDIVSRLLGETDVDVLIIPNLYDLTHESPSVMRLRELDGDLLVFAWLYERATHWILDRNGIRGTRAATALEETAGDDDDDDNEAGDNAQHDGAGSDRQSDSTLSSGSGKDDVQEAADEKQRVAASRPPSDRAIYCVDLRVRDEPEAYVAEVQKIRARYPAAEQLEQWIAGTPRADQLQRYVNNAGRQPIVLDEAPPRRWYPVIDYSRCTNCMECIDFCLFGVYGVDRVETILVEQPDNCRKGCPACSRVCPENAIIFPQHKTPTIAGAIAEAGSSLKIDLSQLFGAPDAVELAAQERDEQLVAVGREAVGMSVGIPKRQTNKPTQPADELDSLIDSLDELDL